MERRFYTLDRYLELKAQGFEFEGQSYLFWEYMRVLTELRKYNPNILFFLENVEMLDKWERCLSHAIGVRGVHINSALVSAQQRKRIYWTNIRVKDTGKTNLFDFDDDPFEPPTKKSDIPQPKDKGIVIDDILQDEVGEKYYLKDDIVGKLLDRTERAKLKDYIEKTQMNLEELSEEIHLLEPQLSKEKVTEIAKKGLKHEVERLNGIYYGT